MQSRDLSRIDQLNCIIFPMIYGEGNQEDSTSQELLKLMIKYAQDQNECIIKKSRDRLAVIDSLTKASPHSEPNFKSLKIKFMCKYGCAIKITKEKEHSPINIQIISLQQWATGANDWKAQGLELVNPTGQSSLFAPTLSMHSSNLSTFQSGFDLNLERAFTIIRQRFTQNKLPEYSPQEVQEACKIAVCNGSYLSVYHHKETEKTNSSQIKSAPIISQNISLSKSSPDTAWYMVKAVALSLLGVQKQQKLVSEKFLIGFRGYLLKSAISQKSKNQDYSKDEVEKYKLCLDQLINQYKDKISKNSNKVQKFNTLVSQIEKHLVEIKGGKLTSSIHHKQNFYQKLDVEVKETPRFVCHEQAEHKKQMIEEKQINDFPTKIQGRYPFQELIDIYNTLDNANQSDVSKWILLTQKVMWNFTNLLYNNNKTIDFNIHSRQLQCEIGASTIGEVVLAYEVQVRKKMSYYGMQLQGQAQSHIQLIRAIAAIITFQSVSLNRERRKSNLLLYRVPFDIDDLYNKFHSNSADARTAMKLLKVYYSYRSQKKAIFELSINSTSFHDFGRKVGYQTRSAQAWKKAMDKLLQTEKSQQMYKGLYKQAQQKITTIQYYANNPSMINSTISSSPSVNIDSPCQYYPTNDPWLYAFLNNIPPDVLGMIKMLHLAQNATKEKKLDEDTNLMFINSAFTGQKLPVNISAKRISKTQSISTITINHITTLSPEANSFLYCGDTSQCTNYESVQFYHEVDKFYCQNEEQIKQIKQNLRFFLYPPDDKKMTRQHQVYAKLHQKPEEMQLEGYEAMCNVRSAQNTQLLLLCSGILERKIISNSYDQSPLFAERLVLQTGGKISTYNKQTQKYFKKGQKLIRQFMKVWIYSDTSFCPIIAPLLSFLGQEIIADNLVSAAQANQMLNVHYELSKKCLEQFKRAQKELFEKPGQKIQWDQRFVCMAAISCFRQVQLTDNDAEQIVFLLQMIFRSRTSKILSDRQPKPAKKRKFQIELEYSVQKAIFRNIAVISNYIDINKDKLSELVKSLDNSFPQDVMWTKANLFHFKGLSQSNDDIYQLDIYKGSIYKNGKEIACLDQAIKRNPYYVQIFGKDRQFQVFPSHYPHYVRTKDNLNYQFKINASQSLVYFQFSEDGNNIRHIIKKPKAKCEQQIWTLIPGQKIRKSQCHIPQIYVRNHLAWYSDKRKCIAFRKPTFEQMYQIGMVVFLDQTPITPSVISASHITYHGSFENQNLEIICDPKNENYQELILRKNDQKLQKLTPFRVLSKFEPSTFILELKNRKTKEVFYFLHRYLLKFKIVNGTRLLSETYFGYALDCSYMTQQKCLFNKFPCLVLEKYLDSPTIMNNHKRILLVSDGNIGQNGRIYKSLQPLAHVKSYKYDIHDFFEDIRGSTREAIFQMAALMLSINDNIKIDFIEMTPLQYAIYLMKSCFTNRPLTKIQLEKLQNILRLGSTQVVLLSEALWKMSNFLSQILPFPKCQQSRLWVFEQKFLQCRTLYENSYNKNLIRFREKINKDIISFLGMKLHQSRRIQIQRGTESSSDQFEYQRQFWDGVKVYTGQDLEDDLQEIHEQYQRFQQKTKVLNIWNQQTNKQNKVQFPSEIADLRKKHEKDQMMKQMIAEITESFNVYCKEQARISEISKKIDKNEKDNQSNQIKKLRSEALDIIKKIEKKIAEIKKQNETHPDVITGIRPTISPAMYTSILCEKDAILEYYPGLKKSIAKKLKETIKIWLQLKTRTASFERIQFLLSQEKVDVVAVMREVLSPREVVFKKNQWLCFQAEMKVQLWPSQLETYNNLMNNSKSGSFCQLNMGEGKTQVIIPLIILNTIYSNVNSKKPCLPRINLLSSLFEQARGNFFRFISATGFQIPAFQIPFNRKVKLYRNDINAIKHLIDSFSNKAYILMTRESRLSEILRFQQGKIIYKCIQADPLARSNFRQKDANFQFDFSKKDTDQPLIQNDIFDVFDEIDAIMNSKKSYIFSIGDQLDLANDMMRFQIIKLCLEVFLTKYFEQALKSKILVTDETDQEAIEMVNKGEFPIGMRLILENNQTKRLQLRRIIAKTIVFQLNRHEYSFIHLLKEQRKRDDLIEYLIQPQKDNDQMATNIPEASKPQIYLLRGILAYGIFEHCLSMRCGVDFGVPNSAHIKKIAVPYEAADIPSKTSQYEQPDVSTLLSYVAYYTKGLSPKYFEDCLKALLDLSKTSKQLQYQQWVQIMDKKARENFQLKTAETINYNSKAHRQLLYKTFRKNRKTIAFWLIKCVFFKDLKQFARSICSSAWDLAAVKKSVGFSGTKDNRWLYSNKLAWKPCRTPQILGTDGKMIHLITKYTNEVAVIQENNKTLWQRYVDLALQKKAGCIIDAGALCVGKSLKDQIVPWVAEHPQFNSNRFLGISFCDNDGKWLVYDIEGKFYVPRGTTIPDHQTFVIFDQARTRGADLKMDGDIVAALSLGPDLTKDSLMQAAGRLRKLGRNQSLVIMATHEVFSHLETFPQKASQHKAHIEKINKADKEKLPKLIISWCCENSIKDNQDLLMQFAQLGWKHLYSQQHGNQALQQELTTNLEVMYSKPLLFASVSQLGDRARKNKDSKLTESQSGKFICVLLNKYGQTVIKQAGSLDDVCQREVQAEKQKQKEQQDALTALQAISEVNIPDILQTIPQNPFVFDGKFKMTSNLMKTTNSHTQVAKTELPQVYFVKIKFDEIVAISIREASLFIQSQIIQKKKTERSQIFMLNSLNIHSAIISQSQLQGALVSAKFLSGVENYTLEEENILLEQMIQSKKVQKEWKENYNALVSLFLRLKRIYLKKFKGSTLEKLITRLHNEA